MEIKIGKGEDMQITGRAERREWEVEEQGSEGGR